MKGRLQRISFQFLSSALLRGEIQASYPRKHTTHTTHAGTLPTQAPHPRWHEKHAISQSPHSLTFQPNGDPDRGY